MIKRFTFVLIFLFSIVVNAQIILTQDTIICGTQNLTLQAFSGGSNGNSLFLTDDTHSPIVNIGFPFTFYGTAYTDLLISTNGYITFDLSNAGLYSPWTNNTPIPNPGQIPENAIMAPWHDIDPSVGGVIYEGVNGVAPNRVYVVTWCSVPMFSCNSMLNTQQIKLYEGSNKIEMFLQDKPLCLTWAGGTAIQGTVDATSTNFDIVTDPTFLLPRNWPLTWTATNEGWEFIPNGPTAYTINSIPFQPIVAGTINWFDNNWNQIGTGDSITVSPTTTTTYYASINRCDSGGTVIDSITITFASNITSQLTSSDASCFGNDATLTVSPDLSTTSPPWNIQLMDDNGNIILVQNNVWSNHTFTGLYPGTYSVHVVEPITGCSGLSSLAVKQVHIDLSLNAFSQNISCFEGNDGYISVYADSGYPPYQYFIDGVLNMSPPPYDTVFFNNLSAGTYVLSVMDTVNCLIRDTVRITDPNYPLQALAASKTTTCYGQDQGTAVVQGAGGTSPYSYNWYNSGQVSFSFNDSVYGLFAGTYYAEVTDANGCDTFATINVIQPQTPLTASIQIMDVACKGDSTGYIVSTAGGSYAPYSYYWLSGPDTLQSASHPVNITRDSLNNLPTGSYELHIYDAWGCFESYSNVVSEPTNPLASTLNKIQDVDCFGDSTGSVQLIVNGGIPNYTYLWGNGETTIVATNLNAGLHTVWITDNWGCVIEDTISINENSLIEDSITIIQNVSCYGGSDGAVVITSFGGVGSHSYDWSNNHISTSQPDTNSGLLFGSYYVLIEDQLGCRVVDSIFISEPDVLETEASRVAHITCFGFDNGIATAIAIGGTTPYTFAWDSTNGQSGDTVFYLTPGIHTVFVIDAKGCIASDTVIITQPNQIIVNIIDSLTIHPYCTGVISAELTAVASGGTPGYSYLWDDNATIPQTTATATGLAAGIYTITVTDSRGCIATDTTDISTYTNSMDAKIDTQLFAGNVNVSCFGANDGIAIVSAWGAHAPYTYQWFGPNNYTATNDSIDNLFAGAYSVNIEDTNGCLINRYINLTEPDLLQFTSYLSTNETCLGACNGTITLEILGGTFPYFGIATNTSTANVITSQILSDTITFPEICSGIYTITLIDTNNCQSTLIQGGNNQQIIGTSISTYAIIDATTIQDLICYGVPTGELSVQNPMSAPNYTYSWEDLLGNVVSTDTIADSLSAQTYVLLAHYSDSNGTYAGCTTTDTITIAQTDEIMINATVNDVLCNGQSSGSITTAATGGTPNYIYLWSPNGQVTSNINNLISGIYSVDITDNNNCYKTDTFTIDEPTTIVVSITQNGNQLVSTVSGGTPNYSYQWSSGQTNHNIIANNPGAYTLTITDANGCVQSSNTIVITSVIETELEQFSLYPNPFKQETLLEFDALKDVISVKILDVCGNTLEAYDLKNTEQFTIKKGAKASGIYFLEVKVDGETYHKRLVIQ